MGRARCPSWDTPSHSRPFRSQASVLLPSPLGPRSGLTYSPRVNLALWLCCKPRWIHRGVINNFFSSIVDNSCREKKKPQKLPSCRLQVRLQWSSLILGDLCNTMQLWARVACSNTTKSVKISDALGFKVVWRSLKFCILTQL